MGPGYGRFWAPRGSSLGPDFVNLTKDRRNPHKGPTFHFSLGPPESVLFLIRGAKSAREEIPGTQRVNESGAPHFHS